jgi:hypothetical protein
MNRDNKTRCECGGETNYYSGALGYEAMVCTQCGYHWSGQTEAQHERQLFEYRLIKRAVTKDLVSVMEGLLECTELNLDELEPHTEDLIDAAQEAVSRARGESL